MGLVAFLFCYLLAQEATNFAETAKILAVFPFPGPSQYIAIQPFLKNLAARGHELTVINAFPQKQKIENFRDVPVLEVFKNYDDLIVAAIEPRSKWEELCFVGGYFGNITKTILNNENVQRLLKTPSEKFDAVIFETLLTDALFGLAEHFNAHILVGFSSFGTDPTIDEHVGNVSPLAYTPLVRAGFTDRMTFLQRLENFVLNQLELIYMHWIHLPNQAQLYSQYFPDASVDLYTLRKNFSLVLLNQHFSLSYPRPYVPNMIEVGGFHLSHELPPIPADMQTFLETAKEGVIYFSMGSNIKSKDLPRDKLEVFMKTFGALNQSIMWKFEDTNLPGKPDNVFINSWFPQPAILSHPKVKLFITHGGLLSTIEAIFHGKPVIGIPMFYDQFLNVERAKKAGFGLSVDFNTISVENLKAAIEEILGNASFTDKAKKMSERYHDQPMSPMETAVFWMEYVLRHDGAPHMRVAAVDLNFIENNCLDILLVFVVGFVLAGYLVIFVLSKLIGFIRRKASTKGIKQKSQ